MTEDSSHAGSIDHPTTGTVCAAAMFRADDLTLVWCNDQYQSFFVEPYRTEGGVGHAYSDISPVGFALHAEDMRAVNETGEMRSGEDRIFSVEDGIATYNWTIQQTQPGFLLALIRKAQNSDD